MKKNNSKITKIPKIRYKWDVKPASKPHSSKKGNKGYNRKDTNWTEID